MSQVACPDELCRSGLGKVAFGSRAETIGRLLRQNFKWLRYGRSYKLNVPNSKSYDDILSYIYAAVFSSFNIWLVAIVALGLNIGAATHSKSHIAMPESMTNPHLRVLNALRAGTKPIMTFMGLPSFRTAQIVAQTGVDVPLSSSHLTLLFTDDQKGYHNRLRAWAHQRRFHAQCHSRYRRSWCLTLSSNSRDAF
jgi:hypothetical protein